MPKEHARMVGNRLHREEVDFMFSIAALENVALSDAIKREIDKFARGTKSADDVIAWLQASKSKR
jgi:hypothetical protein